MVVLIATCFISIPSGYLNINQVASVRRNVFEDATALAVCTVDQLCFKITDNSPEDFMKRVKETCQVEVK